MWWWGGGTKHGSKHLRFQALVRTHDPNAAAPFFPQPAASISPPAEAARFSCRLASIASRTWRNRQIDAGHVFNWANTLLSFSRGSTWLGGPTAPAGHAWVLQIQLHKQRPRLREAHGATQRLQRHLRLGGVGGRMGKVGLVL